MKRPCLIGALTLLLLPASARAQELRTVRPTQTVRVHFVDARAPITASFMRATADTLWLAPAVPPPLALPRAEIALLQVGESRPARQRFKSGARWGALTGAAISTAIVIAGLVEKDGYTTGLGAVSFVVYPPMGVGVGGLIGVALPGREWRAAQLPPVDGEP